MRFRTVHLNVHTIVSEEFALYIRYQMVPNHVHKPRAVHLTVDFIPVSDCVKLATPLCFLRFRAPIYSKNTVEVSLRPPDGTKTHDLVDVTLGLHGCSWFFLRTVEFPFLPCAHVKPFFVDIDPRNLPIVLHMRISQVFGAEPGIIQVSLCPLSSSFDVSRRQARYVLVTNFMPTSTLTKCELI